MFRTTADGKLAERAKKAMNFIDNYIEYYEYARGHRPPNITISRKMKDDLYDPDYKGDLRYKDYEVQVETG